MSSLFCNQYLFLVVLLPIWAFSIYIIVSSAVDTQLLLIVLLLLSCPIWIGSLKLSVCHSLGILFSPDCIIKFYGITSIPCVLRGLLEGIESLLFSLSFKESVINLDCHKYQIAKVGWFFCCKKPILDFLFQSLIVMLHKCPLRPISKESHHLLEFGGIVND